MPLPYKDYSRNNLYWWRITSLLPYSVSMVEYGNDNLQPLYAEKLLFPLPSPTTDQAKFLFPGTSQECGHAQLLRYLERYLYSYWQNRC